MGGTEGRTIVEAEAGAPFGGGPDMFDGDAGAVEADRFQDFDSDFVHGCIPIEVGAEVAEDWGGDQDEQVGIAGGREVGIGGGGDSDIEREAGGDALVLGEIVEGTAIIIGQEDGVVADVGQLAANAPVEGEDAGGHGRGLGSLGGEEICFGGGHVYVRNDDGKWVRFASFQFHAGNAAGIGDDALNRAVRADLNAQFAGQPLNGFDEAVDAVFRQPEAIREFAVGQDGEDAGEIEGRAAEIHAVAAEGFADVAGGEEAGEFVIEGAPNSGAQHFADREAEEPLEIVVLILHYEFVKGDAVFFGRVGEEGGHAGRGAGGDAFAFGEQGFHVARQPKGGAVGPAEFDRGVYRDQLQIIVEVLPRGGEQLFEDPGIVEEAGAGIETEALVFNAVGAASAERILFVDGDGVAG